MKPNRSFSIEFLFQVAALLLILLCVHFVYQTIVRPQARADLAAQARLLQADPSAAQERSVYVMVKDYEQEACFVLLFWALSIMTYKGFNLVRDRSMMDDALIPLAAGQRILPDDTRELSRRLQALPAAQQRSLVPRALLAALQRFGATGSIQEVARATQNYCEAEGERLDSDLAMIRYIAWAIPSIGFIGTVRGIGDALGQAHEAVAGDIFGVTTSLGVAFNSTLIALLISIVLMFALHQLQRYQERYVLDAATYCEEKLVAHLQN
jgi:biopolymer transport protein ExbB/TolQ